MKPLYLFFLVPFMTYCSNGDKQPDAWGNFEATEIIISSETAGKIISVFADEGKKVSGNDLAAIIDTSMLILQLEELRATIAGTSTRISSIDAQIGVLEQQIKNLDVDIERVKNMLEGNAATRKQLDDLTGQVNVLKKQIEANNSQKESVFSELGVLGAREAILNEQLSKCYVKFPSDGTVLARYCEPGELTGQGKPLLKIADLSLMKLKVFVSGAQLSSVKIGDGCIVKIDNGSKDYKEYKGTITRISDKAEFTPKIIQTREERVDLVYAVTIEVPNDGAIKSGMPGEATFNMSEGI